MDFLTLIAILLICGVVAAAIGQRKNLSVGGSFALGAILGIIGIAIVVFQKPGLPKAPAGMRAVKCPRCNAVQNIGKTQTTYECWQCKTVAKPKPPPPGVLAPGAPVKVVAAGDEHEGQVGVVQELVNEDEDGLDVCVKFNGDKEVYAFSRDELIVVVPRPKAAPE